MREIELTNDIGGSPNYQNKIKLVSASYGFPETQYNEGHEFNPGDDVYFWHSVNYTFSVEPNIVQINGIDNKARHWNNNNNIGLTKEIFIDKSSSFTSIIAFYMPTYHLTVADYFDGGSSNNNFEITWHNPDPDIVIPWQYGSVFNAFRYEIPNFDFYSVKALTPMQSLGATWHFYKWNDGTTNNIKSNLQITAPTSFTAYYKGIQRSEDEDAYVSSSQRKFIRTDDNILHNVYSSQGRVWYEISTNNGVTWYRANNGNPLDNGEGKLPSIDYAIYYYNNEAYYQVFIVFQEYSDGASKIKVKYFQSFGGGIPYDVVLDAEAGSVPGNYYSTNTTPVIGVHSNYFTVVWKRTGDLYAKTGHINIPGGIFWDSGNALTGTTPYSINPTISFSKTFYAHQKLAWEEGSIKDISSIKYATLSNAQISGLVTTPSNGGGFTKNYSPSIVQFMDASRLCWVGYRWIDDGIGEEDGFAQTRVLFKAPESAEGRFWQFGTNVSSPNINRKTGDNTYYAFAWQESSGENKFADNTLSTVRTLEDINNIALSGQNVQVTNGPSKDNIFCLSFKYNTGLPYYFQMSDDLGSFYSPGKTTNFAFKSGREGVISVDSAGFYFALGDLEINDEPVDFREIEDTIPVSDLSVMNEYLVSEPFNVSDNSTFIYSVQYGITDSASAVNVMTENLFINFKVKLVDNSTGETIGEFDDVTYNSENIYQYNNISYNVTTQGVGNRTARLKLVIENNFDCNYSLSKIYSDESVLGKNNFKEINISGNNLVTTYELFQNYPNPFNPTTTIKYQIPKPGNVTLKVYDILGSEVATLVDGFKEIGRYESNFYAGNLASGVYIYKLNVNDYTNVKKMVILK